METKNKTQWMYSVFSGETYQCLISDIKILDIGQIPLKKLPNSSCKKCYGKMNLGRDSQNYAYLPCYCLKKVVDSDIIESLEKFKINQ